LLYSICVNVLAVSFVALPHKSAVIYCLASLTSCSVGEAHHFKAPAYSNAKVFNHATNLIYSASDSFHLKKLTILVQSLNFVFQILSDISYNSLAVATAVQFLELEPLDDDVLQASLVLLAVANAQSV
jgi:hypothetical protein